MNKQLPVAAALAAASILNLCAAESSEPLARVGDVEVSVADVKPRLDGLSDREREALAANPAMLNQYVRSLIVQQMVLRKALTSNFDKQPEIQAQLDQLREQAITQSYLQAVSQPPEGYPSDAELKSAYDENKEALHMPKQFRLAQIFVALPPDANKEATAVANVKLDDVKSLLAKNDVNFAAIARARSDEARSASNGGEIGWLTSEQIQPGIREKIATLKAGQTSAPIRLDDGYHIVKVLEIKEPYTPELAEVREALAERMRTAKARENSEAYLAELVKESPVAINEIKLSELLPEPEKKPDAPNAKN